MKDQNNWGYAVRNDGSWRMVNGHSPVKGDPEWSYPDPATEKFVPAADGPPAMPERTEGELVQEANAQRDQLLTKAATRMGPLQDAADIGVASAEKTELLKQWKLYRISLDDISKQKGFPKKIAWPLSPEGESP